MKFVAACALLLLPCQEADLDRVRAHWLAVAAPGLEGELEPLRAHRSRTMTTAVVRADAVAARFGPGPDGIAKFAAKAKARFLVLAGDADRVPTFVKPSAYTSTRFPSDQDLATDHLFGPVAGRLPADTAEELRVMVEKLLAFERDLPGGAWQKRIAFVGGEAGFNPLVDQAIERQFTQVVATEIPAAYDVEVAFAKPSSKYCWYPPGFHANAMRMLNEGALFYVYVGHGFRGSLDEVRYNDRSYPILEKRHAGEAAVKAGLPLMVAVACSTGEYDAPAEDCIGEELVKRPRGPAAFIGGSRVTQPYANALFSRALVDQVFRREAATVGEALWGAKEALGQEDRSPLRLQADALAAAIQGPGSLEPMRQDVVLQYNLLGDPATPIRRPGTGLTLQARGMPGPGRTFVVTGEAPDGRVELSFEVPRDRFAHPVELGEGPPAEAIARRYEAANRKWIVRTEALAAGGRFEAELELPDSVKPGLYWLKAWSQGHLAALDIRLPD